MRNRMPVCAFPTFAAPILKAVEKAGYETPRPFRKGHPTSPRGIGFAWRGPDGYRQDRSLFSASTFPNRRISQAPQILCLAPTGNSLYK